jgi:PKD repeat protein
VGSTTAAAFSIPLADTFTLHSRPGAKRIIYLDFNGQVLSGTAWNAGYNGGADIVAPPFDIDGDPSTFSDAERTRIQSIWQRVSEDYSPFDVDVTTELTSEAQITRSATSDEYFGTRVLISPISSYFGNYGGIAYVGVFDDVGDYHKPALVFPDRLGPNGEKYIGEACSHESGHNLGLNHDGTTAGTTYYAGQGTGETGWAPIMGNSYSQNVTQWSKGEYANANNLQDDLAVIQTYGLSYRVDDFGDGAATASYFPAGSLLSVDGVIGRNTDVDVFAFNTAAGTISVSISPAGLGPNLDILAELRDGNDALVASLGQANALAAGVTLNVPAGTYFLQVRGVGNADPVTSGYSSYAALGQYTITGTVVDPTGTVPPVAFAVGTASGTTVQFDGSGSFDQDGTIVGYTWNFGDGTTGAGATVSHTYNVAGTYTATLVVTDNSALTGVDTLTVQILAANQLPVAYATATPASGYAPLPVTFNGSASVDPDGTIASYAWNFGDGSTGSGPIGQHTYQSPGSYTATLTVTDSRGAAASVLVAVQATSNPANTIRVNSIALGLLDSQGGRSVRATVKVTNLSGNPVTGVAVTGNWTGAVTGPGSAVTDASGNAVITSKRFKKSGSVTLTVSGLAKSGLTYSSAQNLQTSATIAAGR